MQDNQSYRIQWGVFEPRSGDRMQPRPQGLGKVSNESAPKGRKMINLDLFQIGFVFIRIIEKREAQAQVLSVEL